MKRKYKLKKKVKVILAIILLILAIISIKGILNRHTKVKDTKIVQSIKEEKKPVKMEINNKLEAIEEEQQEIIEEPVIEVSNKYTTRMTSFYPAESSDCTGSGLCSWDFGVNEHGWYTYNGKLVVATATQYLANQGWYLADGVHTYRYYDEITLVIDGVEYQAIVLDSCGNAMKTDRIDLFVTGADTVKDTTISVRR